MTPDEVGRRTNAIEDEADALSGGFAALLSRERARGFSSLTGTHVEIAAPIRQSLVDRLVEGATARARGTDIRVELLEGARLGVSVAHRVLGVPARAKTVLTIDRSVDLERGRIVLRYDDSFLWRTIRAVVSPLGLLPPGVAFEGGAVVVDLEALAARGGWADVLSWVRRLEIHGPADGLLLVDVELEVRSAGVPVAGPSERAGAAGSMPLQTDEVLAGIAGARARAEVHVAEALVNEALVEVRALAASSERHSRSAGPQPWVSWLRELSVRFDRAQLVVLAEIEVPDGAEGPVTDAVIDGTRAE